MKNKTSEENMTENNLETIFSDIVCSFGGNSSEELFYGMDGSWGISQDLRSANQMAKELMWVPISYNTQRSFTDTLTA